MNDCEAIKSTVSEMIRRNIVINNVNVINLNSTAVKMVERMPELRRSRPGQVSDAQLIEFTQ